MALLKVVRYDTMFTKHRELDESMLDTDEDVQKKQMTIQIKLDGATAQTFRFGRRFLGVAATLTIASAIWGTGVAWWLAWSHVSGGNADKDTAEARFIAAEVSKSISAQGVMSDDERTLLVQIRDHFESFISRKSGRC